jgi:predicted hydrocarbon binding protein
MSGSTLRSWAKVTERILGSGAKGIMYETGKCGGRQFAEMLLREGLKDEELKCALEIFLTNGGWGKVRTELNFQEQEAVVRIRNSVTTRQTKAEEPVCHFISGFIAGALTIVFSKKAECVEIRCKAKGDTFCEFKVSSLG